ncbi:PEP-CTERM sorting domain-containing protein [Microcoleus sp. C2C3]|uniref:PEP-CTERM sorting domain-containing protein n=1 Tax=unclassified Microcoleus TaxID=2642155 RepID=UPI002FD727FC
MFLAPNTAISSAIFGVKANSISSYERFSRLDAYGYIGNGQGDVSDFGAGEYLDGRFLYSVINMNSTINPSPIFSFNVLPFITQRIKNNDTFAGFSFRNDNEEAYLTLNQEARLTIITADITPDVAEPVPEPTTIFGSALALSLGGWLKRKNSSQNNKTTPQS